MKELTVRQSSLMLFTATCSIKLLLLPSLIMTQSGNGIWLTLLTMFLIDFCFILILSGIMKAYPDLTFKELLIKFFGNILTKIFFSLLGLLLCLKVASLIIDLYEFYTQTSYVDLDWITFLIPTILIISFVAIKRLRTLGRSVEIFIYFIAITILLSIIFCISSVDVFSFLPLMQNGFKGTFQPCIDYAFWFGDFVLLYFFMGNVKYDNSLIKSYLITYLVSSFIVILISSIQYGLYGSMSAFYKTTIMDVIEYTPRLNTSGRFTWIIVFLWPIASMFTSCFYMNLAVSSFQNVFNIKEKDNKYIVYSLIGLMVGFLIMTAFSQIGFTKFINSLKYVILVIQYLIPIFIPLMFVKYDRAKRREYVKKSLEK